MPIFWFECEPGRGEYDFEQARFLRDAYERLQRMRHRRHIAGAYWYAWQDQADADPHCAFCQGAGLLRLNGTAKPAWYVFRRLAASARRP